MTNKMKVIFAIVSTVSALFVIVLTTPYVIDAVGRMLSEVVNLLGLHEEPTLSALAVLAIPGLYLYLVLGQRRQSVGEQDSGQRERQ